MDENNNQQLELQLTETAESQTTEKPTPKIKKPLFSLRPIGKALGSLQKQRSVDRYISQTDGKIFNCPRELGIPKFILCCLQCFFIMISVSVAVPLALNLSVSATLLAAALATLIMLLFTGGRVFLFTASCSAFIPVYLSILGDRFDYTAHDIALATVLSGLMVAALGLIFWAFGVERLRRLFDPLVAAPLTLLVGLLSVAQLTRDSDTPWLTLLTAAFGFVFICFGGKIKMLAPLIALVFGTVVAAIAGQIPSAVPDTSIPTLNANVEFAVIGTVLINSLAAVIPTGALLWAGNLQSTSLGGKHARPTGFFMGAGLSMSLSGLLCSPPQLPTVHSVGLSSATGVFDPLVSAVASVLLIALALLPGAGGLFAIIPHCVGLGIGVVLASSLVRFSVGYIKKLDLSTRRSQLIFLSVLISGFIFEGSPITFFIQGRPLVIGGFAVAAIVGTLLNLLIPAVLDEK